MKILVHVCCGPCSVLPLLRLADEGHEVTGFWYNPNIHPYQEYLRRLNTLRREASGRGIPVLYDEGYDIEVHLGRLIAAMGEGRVRCHECYRLRLGTAARKAAAEGFPYFTTSLLISPHQRHEPVREVGEEMGKLHGVEFYYRDFRPWYQEGQELARESVMYRQAYCGCVFSERERYDKSLRTGGYRGDSHRDE